MSLATYTDLKTSIAGWLARADLDAIIPDFIALAEARINRDLHVSQQDATATGTVATNAITLPTDCRAIRALHVSLGGAYLELHPQPPEAAKGKDLGTLPRGYVVIGSTIYLTGTGLDTAAYRLYYTAKVPALSDAAPTNWLLTAEPGAYLYGALVEAAPYIYDDQRAVLWATQYRAVIDGMHASDELLKYGNAPRIGGFRAA